MTARTCMTPLRTTVRNRYAALMQEYEENDGEGAAEKMGDQETTASGPPRAWAARWTQGDSEHDPYIEFLFNILVRLSRITSAPQRFPKFAQCTHKNHRKCSGNYVQNVQGAFFNASRRP